MAKRRSAVATTAEPIDELWGLPDGWEWCRLSSISDIPQRGEPRSKFPARFSYLDVSGIDGGTLSPRAIPVTNAPSRARQFLRPNDTVISGVRVYLRNFALIEKGGPDVASTAFCVLRPKPEIDPQYLFYWVGSDQFIQRLLPLQRGNSPPAVLDADIRNQPIPVPPLAVQRKIVSRVNKLFAEIDEGEGALADARAGLENFRKSLLNAAVTGKLSVELRASSRPTETAREFLNRLRREPSRTPQRRIRTQPKPAPPYPIPSDWAWVTMGDLIEKIHAGLNVKAEGRPPRANEIGIVKVSAVTWDDYDEEASKTLPNSVKVSSNALIQPGDFLISRANTLELVGAPAIVRRTTRRLYLSDKVLRLVLPDCLKEWVYFVLKSPYGRGEIENKSTGNQLSMRNIPQEGIRSIPIPIPPERELLYLTTEIRKAWDLHKNLSDDRETTQDIMTLRQSILSNAFRGELINE